MNDTPTSGQSKEEVALRALAADPRLETIHEMLTEFNLFDILGVERSELQHSRVLAWLLNPRGSHGLGHSFLHEFLAQVVSEGNRIGISRVSPTDVQGWNMPNAEVVRERHNIDILIVGEDEEFVCFIENKVDSGEHSEQLARYYEAVKKSYKTCKRLPVYLTPGAVAPSKSQDARWYVPMGYGRVADLLAERLRSQGATINTNAAGFLQQYEQTLRRRILDAPSDIDRLALKVYSDHRGAINRIIETKSLMNVTTWAIDPAIDRHGPEDLLEDFHGSRYRRFCSKALDGIQELRKDVRWTDSGRIALVEFLYREENHLTLTLMIGPGPQETRERLWELGKRKNFKNSWNLERNLKNGGHFTIYTRTILNEQDFNPFDPEEALQKIDEAVAEFFENDYWIIVNAIREEFGLDRVESE